MRYLIPHLVALGACAPALAGDVVVQVSGVADASGRIAVAVCTETEFLKTCRLAATGSARTGTVSVRLPDVAPGRYAVQAHHDRNGDGKVATNLVGIPSEPVGFSRDPAIRFGPPRFDEAAIEIGRQTTTVPVRLKGGG